MIPQQPQETLSRDLCDYYKLDALAMVKIVKRLLKRRNKETIGGYSLLPGRHALCAVRYLTYSGHFKQIAIRFIHREITPRCLEYFRGHVFTFSK